MQTKQDGFLSYARSDDKYSGGGITKFRVQLESAVLPVTGKPFAIFQDASGIVLGEHWLDKLNLTLDQTSFFIPIITPRFFESRHCQQELRRFLEAEKKDGRNDLILPIYWIDTPTLQDDKLRSENELAGVIAKRQYYDWRHLLFKSFEAEEVQLPLQDLAREIGEVKCRAIRVA